MLTLRLEFPEGAQDAKQGLVYWRVTEEQHDHTLKDSGHLLLAEFTPELTLFQAYANEEVRLWWPSEYAVCVHTSVAEEQQRELMRVPQYELEPFVAQDVEDMHVTAAAPTTGSLLLVGVDKRIFAQVLELLAIAGLDPSQVGLDAEPISMEDGHDDEDSENRVTYAHTLANRVLLFQTGQLVAACDVEHLDVYRAQLHQLMPEINECALERVGSDHPDWWWERAINTTPLSNLRAGEFERQSLWTQVRQWRMVWVTAAAGCVLLALTHIVLIEVVKRNTADLRGQQAALYHSYFPKANQIFDPPAQLRSKLQRPNQPEISTDGLATYALFSDKLATLPSSERGPLKRVSFSAKHNELRIQLSLSSIRTLESLVEMLNLHGLATHIESATYDEQGVAAQLSMQIIRLS